MKQFGIDKQGTGSALPCEQQNRIVSNSKSWIETTVCGAPQICSGVLSVGKEAACAAYLRACNKLPDADGHGGRQDNDCQAMEPDVSSRAVGQPPLALCSCLERLRPQTGTVSTPVTDNGSHGASFW